MKYCENVKTVLLTLNPFSLRSPLRCLSKIFVVIYAYSPGKRSMPASHNGFHFIKLYLHKTQLLIWVKMGQKKNLHSISWENYLDFLDMTHDKCLANDNMTSRGNWLAYVPLESSQASPWQVQHKLQFKRTL